MQTRLTSSTCVVCLTILVSLTSMLWAQTVGSITGRVGDQSGAVLPGATVQVTQEETGITRTVVTDEEGRYAARDLSLGTYRIEATLQGFQKVLRTGVLLTIGREAIVDIKLPVGEISEQVTVTGDAPLIDVRSAEVAGLVTRNQMANLPLNARDFSQLIGLQAGTTTYRNQTGDGTSGFGARISVNGARVTNNSFTLDGSDVGTSTGILSSGVNGATLGLDAIREFKVLSGNYSALYGRTAGANIIAVTRSGSNEFHGSVYEYLRNDNLDARRFFDLAKPEFKRNQYGFSIGGPIRKDKTFFFANLEQLKERFPLTFRAVVPNVAARSGILPSGTVTVSPAVKPYLALWPLPNGKDLGSGTAEFNRSDNQPTDQTYLAVRVDQQLSEKHSLFGRYTLDRSKQVQPFSIPLFADTYESRNQYITFEERAVLTPRLVNQFRIAYSRPVKIADIIPVNAPDPSLSFVKGRRFGGINVGSGVTSLSGFDQAVPRNEFVNTGQLYNDISWELGRHSVKIGGSLFYYQFDKYAVSREGGGWTFGSLSDFIQNRPPTQLRIMGFNADPYRTFTQWLTTAYVQDDVRLRQNLTVNLGVRYEYLTTPEERYGRMANLRSYLDPQQTLGSPWYENPSGKNFDPRIGFAWDPRGDGKTSIRAGFGVFHDPLLMKYYIITIDRQPPFWMDVAPAAKDLGGLFPDLTSALPRLSQGPSAIHAFDYHIKSPYSLQWSLGIQKELASSLMAEVSYSASRGVHLASQQDVAVPVPQFINGITYFAPNAPLLTPNFSRLQWYSTGASSSYHALRTLLTKRMAGGLHFQTAYTWSKALDIQSSHEQAELSDFNVMDAFNMGRDWGPANFHVAHVFTANFSYELPFGPGRSWAQDTHGVLGGLIGGWQVSGILSATTGTPFNASSTSTLTHPQARQGSRANLKAGGDNNPVLGTPEKWFDATQFEPQTAGYYGNVGRGTIIGPGLAVFDLSLLKNTRIAEGKNLQFRAEFFNLPNHANFALPASNLFDSQRRPVATAGRITNTVTSARQIQLALRFEF